ncbi:GNAT family N-acetyltransferase [Neptuniibacter sp.]|uniref:GNAT family N-acetyltransferase n=1 Tax=Neptuniibacter sp. TaxID=1962643 RepID=UPI00337875B5|nr:GNAT family N-acetyltransferase [Neptuniibacter sp.]
MTSKFNISTGAQLKSPALGRFYKRNGHKGKVQPNDICFWTERDQAIVAAARLQPVAGERNSLLLRGLWVDKALRRKGLGSELLQRITHYLQEQSSNCYCLAYANLENFYKRQRFNQPSIESCPSELLAQYHSYKKRGNNLTLLFYSA